MMPSLRPTMSTLSGGFNEVTGRYMIDAISSRKALTWPVWRRNSWPRRPHGHSNRVSLLRAAAYHGSSHQAAMTFQVIVPKQLRDFEIGRHRLQFVYQSPAAFAQVNQPDLLGSMKSDVGFAKVAGIELTLLDCTRYFHKSGGHQRTCPDRQRHWSAVRRPQTRQGRRGLRQCRRPPARISARSGRIQTQSRALEPFVKAGLAADRFSR
jgi:hypothetical protein